MVARNVKTHKGDGAKLPAVPSTFTNTSRAPTAIHLHYQRRLGLGWDQTSWSLESSTT